MAHPASGGSAAESAMASRTHEDAPQSQNGAWAESGQGGATESPSESKYGGRGNWPDEGGKLEGASGMAQLARSAAEHVRPYGARDAFSRRVYALVGAHKASVVEHLTQPEHAREWLDTLMAGVRAKDRTCIRLYADVTGLAEVQDALVAEFLARVGVATLEAVEEKLERVRDASVMTAEQRAAACAEYLELYLNKYPEQRRLIVSRLGGQVEVRSDSFAKVVEGK